MTTKMRKIAMTDEHAQFVATELKYGMERLATELRRYAALHRTAPGLTFSKHDERSIEEMQVRYNAFDAIVRQLEE